MKDARFAVINPDDRVIVVSVHGKNPFLWSRFVEASFLPCSRQFPSK
jgi:hypothetical protein